MGIKEICEFPTEIYCSTLKSKQSSTGLICSNKKAQT